MTARSLRRTTGGGRMDGSGPLRILACFPYSRHSWVAPLEALAARGHEVTYLGYRTPAEEPPSPAIPAGRARVHWRAFGSGQHVIRSLAPDRIVLMGTEGAWQLSVVAAARRLGVPTAVLQHGVKWPMTVTTGLAQHVPRGARGTSRLPAIRFVVRSLAHSPADLIRTFGYLVDAARTTPWEAGPRHPLDARRADLYLTGSEPAADLYQRMDHVGPERILRVGLPEFDELLRATLPPSPGGRALLIDTPHTGGPHLEAVVTGPEKHVRLTRLGVDLAEHGWRLTVKLHPDSYGDAWAVDGPAVAYVRDADPERLIGEATVVLGFDSTLLLPAMHHRPVVVLREPLLGTWFADTSVRLGAVPDAPTLEEVRAERVLDAARDEAASRPGRDRLVAAMLGPADGRSLDRIEGALRRLTVRR